MSGLILSSDLHLGHKSICGFRTQFATPEEHHNTVYENLATNITKRDTLMLLGDVAFDQYWLNKIGEINCSGKILILGNHDTDKAGRNIHQLVKVFDKIHSLQSKNDVWYSHCPIHPKEMRNRRANVHGHTHQHNIDDKRYINICLEQTDYKPVRIEWIRGIMEDRGL